MKPIFLLLLSTLSLTCLGQGYFEQKINELGIQEYNTQKMASFKLSKAGKFNSRTLVIPEYSKESTFNDFALNKEFAKMTFEEKEAHHRVLFLSAAQKSDLKLEIQVGIDSYEDLSVHQRQDYLFLSYSKKMGIKELVIFDVDETGEEYMLSVTYLPEMDLTDEAELVKVFNLIDTILQHSPSEEDKQSIEDLDKLVMVSLEYRQEKERETGNDMAAGNFSLEIGREVDEEKYSKYFNTFFSEEKQYKANQTASTYLSAALSRMDTMILVIPFEEKGRKLDALMANWKFSKYLFATEDELASFKSENPEKYFTINRLDWKMKFFKTSSIIFKNLENDVFYRLDILKKSNTHFKTMRRANNIIGEKIHKYSPYNTIRYYMEKNEINAVPFFSYGDTLEFVPVDLQYMRGAQLINEGEDYTIFNRRVLEALEASDTRYSTQTNSSRYKLYSRVYDQRETYGMLGDDDMETGIKIVKHYIFLIYDQENKKWYNLTGQGKPLNESIDLLKDKLKQIF